MPLPIPTGAQIPEPTCSISTLPGLLTRLLDDHQRMYPHHGDLCQLCQNTKRSLDLMARALPCHSKLNPHTF